jgi:glycosyltransferase involved in cell wall biosynthesis
VNQPTLRILFIASRADIAGGESYLLAVFRHLDRARFTPIVWLPADGPFRAALDGLGIETRIEPVDYGWFAPPLPWYRFLAALPERVRGLADYIRARGLALVHTNSNMILEGALAAQIAGVPHLHVTHAYFDTEQPIWQRLRLDAAGFASLVADLSARVVAVSPALGEEWLANIGPEKLRVIPNGLPLEIYAAARRAPRDTLRRELGLAADAPLVVAAGRLDPEKGFEHYLEAAALVLRTHPEAYFLLAGSTDSATYHASLEERVRRLGIQRHFHFLGYRTDLPHLLAQCEVFVLTSRQEGGPYVLLEAMACGCAPVATRCGGLVPGVVIPHETGILVDFGDVAATAEAIGNLLGDRAERERMAGNGCRLVFEKYDERAGVTRLMQTYEEAVACPAAGHRYVVELFMLAATETGYLGQHLTTLEERMKRTERAADLLLDNPFMRLLRRLLGRG